MKRYVDIQRQSKKVRKEYYKQFRNSWGPLNPSVRVMPNKKKNAKEAAWYGKED